MEKIINCYPNMDTTGMEDKPTIIQKLQDSKEKYREAIAKGKQIRHEFLLERAEIAHENGSQTIKAAIKQLAHIKASIQTYASIKWVMSRTTYQQGITSIRIPNEDGTYQTIIDATEIESQLINRNHNHYAQAEHTVMAHHLIREEMGVLGTSEFCDKILLGTADLAHLPATLQAIFRQLHQPHLVEVNNLISFDDYKDALQRWKESTSMSPSGCHLGHYVTLLKQIGDETDEVGEKYCSFTTLCSE
jgi:predicted small secreted protein